MFYLKLTVLILFLSSSALSSATEYSRGNDICDDFEEVKELYQMEPNDIDYQFGYGYCLVLKGEDDKGLSLLYPLSEHYNDIPSAFFIAKYIETGGKLDSTIDRYNIEKAIQAHFRVLFLIDVGPNYPYDPDHRLYEINVQAELSSTYKVPYLYLKKFQGGAYGNQNRHLLMSPSYEGERDLETYPDYSPYTIDSLSNIIEFANRCIALPKKSHFMTEYYKAYQKACQILKDVAETLMPMELEALTLLATESCGKDLPNCQEYDELTDRQSSLENQAHSELGEVFSIDTE